MSKNGGNQKKFGRGHRSPASASYHAAQRWVANKAKAIKRETRMVAKCAIRKIMRQNPSSRDYTRLAELRHVVSQNMTG